MKTTQYFDYTRKRPDRTQIKNSWIKQAIENPEKTEIQSDGRIKKWAKIEEADKYLRVILLEDGNQFIMPSSIDHSRRRKDENKILF
jgi:hypothetical protein